MKTEDLSIWVRRNGVVLLAADPIVGHETSSQGTEIKLMAIKKKTGDVMFFLYFYTKKHKITIKLMFGLTKFVYSDQINLGVFNH